MTFVRTVLVSPVGTPTQNGAALVAAVATLGSASASNPYLVRIEPGIYDLGSQFLNLPSSVDVEGSGAGVTKLLSAAAPVIVLGTASELRHITVESTAGLAIRTSGRVLHVVAKASGGSSNTGIEAQPAESIIHSTVIVSGPGVVNRGVQIGGSIVLTNVTVETSGASSTNVAVDFIGTGAPRFTNLNARVVGGATSSDTAKAISLQGNSTATLMSVQAVAENGGQFGGTIALYAAQGNHLVTDSTLATKGPFIRNAIQLDSSAFVRVEQSRIMTSGNAYSVSVQSGTTLHIAASRVEGTPFLLFGQGTVVCSAVYNANLTFFPNACP